MSATKKFQRINARGEIIATDEDDDGILKDGEGIRVSLFMMDELQRTVAADAAARGGHRSGYQVGGASIMSDAQRAAVTDERTAAYEERSQWLADAWRTPSSKPVNDADKQMNDATLDREAAYDEYRKWLQDAWRGTAA